MGRWHHRAPRAVWFALVAALLALAPLAGCARREPEPAAIAVLLADDVRLEKVEGLKEGLAELGYPPERVAITVYSAGGDRSRLPALAAEAIAARPDVLVAGGGIEADTLHKSDNPGIPVVMAGVASPVRWGWIDSYARPGGLLTGLDNQHAELAGKRLELLTKLLPDVERVLVLYDPQVIPGIHALEVAEEAAGLLGVSLGVVEARSLAGALAGLGRIEPGEYDAALFLPAFVLESGAGAITAELERLGLPAMGALDLGAEAGLMAAYGNSNRAQGRQAARFVVKVLNGADPATLPIESIDNPELVVNLDVANRLGLTLKPEGMAFAHVRGASAGERGAPGASGAQSAAPDTSGAQSAGPDASGAQGAAPDAAGEVGR